MRLKIFFLFTMLFLIICFQNGYGQNYRKSNKPEVFFENIHIGDNLETCLAKGTVQYRHNSHKFKLNSDIVNQYFYYSNVKFDEKNIIKEAELKFHQPRSKKTAEEVFNFMTQYFCQRYSGMKTTEINEERLHEDYDMKCRHEGIKIVWETDKIKIILKSYYNTPDYTPIPRSSENEVVFDWGADAAKELKGNWVELNITAK